MPTYLAPDIYVEEVSGGARPIEAVGTSTAGFIGVAPNPGAHLNQPVAINNWAQFGREFVAEGSASTDLSQAVYGFFLNGGSRCYVVNVGPGNPISGGEQRTGIDTLEQIDEIAILAAPGYVDAAAYDALLSHCERLQDRVAILDAPADVTDINLLTQVTTAQSSRHSAGEGEAGQVAGLRPRQSDGGYGAFYFPRITVRDPLAPSQMVSVPPSGHMAGIWARTDATRGVHKAPANEIVRGALNVGYRLTRAEQGELNTAGVNCIRFFGREGIRVWGARTLAASSSEWRYLNVRRLFNMIKESIANSTRWIVFEPNDFTLWKSIRRDITAFLTGLWRDGALMGRTPEEAFFVKCDEETNPPDVIDAGIVVTLIGIAPVKPAEFIVFRISQKQAGTEVETQGGA
jgi:phage tail sheath protein FI